MKMLKTNCYTRKSFIHDLKLLIFISITLFAGSCKPTEKGYKAAYDAALGKRDAAMADIDVNLPEGALQQVDGPQLKEIYGDKFYIENKRLKPAIEGEELPGQYNVAVGTYKMITNCKSQAEDLIKDGYSAFPAVDTEDKYYTIAGSFTNMREATKFYNEFKKVKNRVYVGLPDSPVIIFSPK